MVTMMESGMVLIGVSGYSGAGKDLLAEFLIKDHGYVRFAFGDRVKEALYILNPCIGLNQRTGKPTFLKPFIDAQTGSFTEKWDKAKSIEEVRRLLQRLGTNVGRDYISEEIWTEKTFDLISEHMRANRDEKDRHYVIPDVRFPSEADRIHRTGGVVIRIHRPGVGPLQDSKGRSHESETALDDSDCFDYHVHNEGSIMDFSKKTDRLINHIIEEARHDD